MNNIVKKFDIIEIISYTSFYVFVGLLFIANRNVSTKWFYLTTSFVFIYIILKSEKIKELTNNRIFLSCLALISYSVCISYLYGQFEFNYLKSGVRLIIFISAIIFFVRNKLNLTIILNIIVVCTLLGSFWDLYEYVASGGYQSAVPFGVGTKYLWHIFAGGIYSIAAMFALYLADDNKYLPAKFVYIVIFVFLNMLILISQSRSAILCYMLSVMLYLILKKKLNIKYLIITITSVLLVSWFVSNNIYMFASLVERKDAYRLEIWSKSFDMIKGNILFGHGLGADFHLKFSSGTVTGPHNLYLYAMFTGGLVCLLLLLFLYYMAITSLLRNWNPDLGPLMAAILLFIMTFNFFDSRMVVDDIGVGWHLFWFPIGLIAAFASLQDPVKDEASVDTPV